MQERLMWVRFENDAKLSRSHKSPGDSSPLTRDAEGRLGQVVLADVDPAEVAATLESNGPSVPPNGQGGFSTALATALVAGALEGAIEALKPHVADWWRERGRSAVGSFARSARVRARLRGTQAKDEVDAQMAPTQSVVPTDAVPGTSIGPRQNRPEMTTSEAEQRLAAALLARAFSDEQLRVITAARIVDDDGQPVVLQLEEISPAELASRVDQLLDAHPALLDRLADAFAETVAGAEGQSSPADDRQLDTPATATD